MSEEEPQTSATAATGAATAPPETALTIEEFCVRLSTRDKRYPLISGFDHTERKAKRLKDLPSEYQKRFEVFVKTPSKLK